MGVLSEWFGEDVRGILRATNKVDLDFLPGDEFANVMMANVDMLDLRVQFCCLGKVDGTAVIAPKIPGFSCGISISLSQEYIHHIC